MKKYQDSFDEVFSGIERVLVVLAHPDDMEINCGGVIARLVDNKKQVRLVITTNGGKGVKDRQGITESNFAQSRIREQLEAGKVLGIDQGQNINLNVPDGGLEPNIENIGKIAFHIRQFKPDIVITHNPDDYIIDFFGKSTWTNHRDHRHTGQIVLDACYPYSRDRGFFPEHFSESKLMPHIVKKILITDSYTKPNLRFLDISSYLQYKKQALQKHISAFSPDDADDYISENRFGDSYYEPLGYYEIY